MKMSRVWAMPNKQTFTINQIKHLILKYIKDGDTIVDPYANKGSIKKEIDNNLFFQQSECINNDLNKKYKCNENIDGKLFISLFGEDMDYFDKGYYPNVILYDPPYSPRQLKECYDDIGLSLTQKDTQSSYWSETKDMISKVQRIGDYCISFGWNSNGIGKTRGYEIVEILIVAHGGSHNDTICVVEKKNI